MPSVKKSQDEIYLKPSFLLPKRRPVFLKSGDDCPDPFPQRSNEIFLHQAKLDVQVVVSTPVHPVHYVRTDERFLVCQQLLDRGNDRQRAEVFGRILLMKVDHRLPPPLHNPRAVVRVRQFQKWILDSVALVVSLIWYPADSKVWTANLSELADA